MSLKSDIVLYMCVNFNQCIDLVNALVYYHLSLTLQAEQGALLLNPLSHLS